MYHQFTKNPDGEPNLTANYLYVSDFERQMKYIHDKNFYLPTWSELNSFIDGKLFLPANSLIITDDDADRTWFELAVPIVDKYKVLATSFVITKWRHEASPSKFVLQRSHTDSMHEAGANQKGLMTNLPQGKIAADMEKSAKILGAKEVMAYPMGDYNETAFAALKQAGFDMAVTVSYGKVHIGSPKLTLPRVRISYGITMDEFKAIVGG
jgi:peptidoglycan/xylan/chitin deacetylase (PgdA/CDA1 family)